MWVWQSQAPGGTEKLTGVRGWEAAASAAVGRYAAAAAPAASEPSRKLRREIIVEVPFLAESSCTRNRGAPGRGKVGSAEEAMPGRGGRHSRQPRCPHLRIIMRGKPAQWG